jgi:hypothetical protein
MASYRFEVGTTVMCNLGTSGWKIGRIVDLNYREENWAKEMFAPYQVLLEDNYSLIYVPKDDDRFCRAVTNEDIKILNRNDALAELKSEKGKSDENSIIGKKRNLNCNEKPEKLQYQSYRKGRCLCCNDCPRDWLYAELYSEHYRCASRNNIKITRHEINLGKVKVGDVLNQIPDEFLANKAGFMQSPTLVKLPPGVTFSDYGCLTGEVRYDPHRGPDYEVNFVAVSTADWNNDSVGIVRLEIKFEVEGNHPPRNFDVADFENEQKKARLDAIKLLKNLNHTWDLWESEELGNRATCDRMLSDLNLLRELAESHPRLDNGRWWGQLGGFHMNVHKLLENTLFECELYLGYALTFGDDEVRYYAEQNLKGCYQKRQLEAARFMWYDGIELMLQNKWEDAIEVFKQAALKKEGWGWAVNYGDIWLSEAVAVIFHGVEATKDKSNIEETEWVNTVEKLLEKSLLRANESGLFGENGHPWSTEVALSLKSYKELTSDGKDTNEWLIQFKSRTIYWCSQVLSGGFPFPPKVRARLDSESNLIEKLPLYNL